ncbi:sulfatase [Gelidibacter salicanalis]|uniref:Sulfatase n=1 Tax=Gelidibacter salicanalis TaxID=291193 RepID=A0A934KYT1_9FLAO|nr:sulfatase [Gelidibacter salicanalis]MBJ7882983.1 sulfatase [Gelidibacter salicanalis]
MRFIAIMYSFLMLNFSGCGQEKKENTSHPNILFIAVDDLRPDLGCYGNTIVQSPHIDKLASEGVTFTNHFVQVPTCGASRYNLLTGMRPKTKAQLSNEVIYNEISNQPERANPESFIHHLKRNGYHTVGIGKISHSADGLLSDYNEKPSDKRELPYSWSELLFDSGKWGTGWNAFFGYANGENRQSLHNKVKPYEAGKVDDLGYPDGLTTQLAISKLKELKNQNKPFFLGVGFFKPHLPFNSPEKYWDLYQNDAISISPYPEIPQNSNRESLHDSNEFNQYTRTDEIPNRENRVSDAYAKKLRHAYYASVSYIDHQIGMILSELKALDLEENTIVVVWGDHGWHLGDQKVWGKHTLFENALKSALIIKVPGTRIKNKKSSTIVETVDIYPTLMELCNVNMPHKTDGKSFVPLLHGDPMPLTESVAYSYFNDGMSLRTEKYRLTTYFRADKTQEYELYDHTSDAPETQNIANDHPEIVQKLVPLLNKGDTGLFNK